MSESLELIKKWAHGRFETLADLLNCVFEGDIEGEARRLAEQFCNRIENLEPLPVFTKFYGGSDSYQYLVAEVTANHIDALDHIEKYRLIFDQTMASKLVDPTFAITCYYDMMLVEGIEGPAHAFIIHFHNSVEKISMVFAKGGEISADIRDYILVEPNNIITLDNKDFNGLATGLIASTYSRVIPLFKGETILDYWKRRGHTVMYGDGYDDYTFAKAVHRNIPNLVLAKQMV